MIKFIKNKIIFNIDSPQKLAYLLMVIVAGFSLIFQVINAYTQVSTYESYDCIKQKESIINLIKEAQYCNKDEDCLVASKLPCPFSCFILNKNTKFDSLEKEANKYKHECGRCIEECPVYSNLKCENNICVGSKDEKN